MQEYDSQNTMIALNMAIASVNKIIASHDRVVLEWEYRNIINRLALGSIESDPEMKGLYTELMNFITGRGLRDEDIKLLRESYDRREQEAWYSAMSQGVESSRSSFGLWNWLGSKTIGLFSHFLGRDFMTSWYGADYRYNAEKQRIPRDIDAGTRNLTKADIEACNGLYTRLLSSSWTLLRRYGLSDDYRLTSESLEAFSLALNEDKPSNRLEMLRFIERLFSAYPPYWFWCAVTAYEAGHEYECRIYMDKFDEVWRPVLRYDPCKLEAAKYRIRELASEGTVSGEKSQEIRRLADTVREYTPPGDWSSNLFAGMVYFALGEKEQGARLVKANVLFNYEKDISGNVLAQLEAGRFETAKLTAGLHWLFETDLSKLDSGDIAKLAERGNPEAQYRLGCMYYYGNGRLSQDYSTAFHWFMMSAEQGHMEAQNFVGVMYRTGKGTRQDDSEALKWYKRSAEHGNSVAQSNLGGMYYYAYGVKQDYGQALIWFTKSAEQGDSDAQNYLGNMYRNGQGVSMDYQKSLYWYRKSAEQENAFAQSNLGIMYEFGYGVSKDYAEAVKWYRKSAEQGNAYGQFNLGDMYEFGKGIEANSWTARYWYQLAAAQGHEGAKKAIERLKKRMKF